MSFFDCISEALKQKILSDKMLKGMEDHLKQHGIEFNEKTDFNTPEAKQAIEEAIKNFDEVTAKKKQQLVLGVKARQANELHITENGGKRPVRALEDQLQKVENRRSVIMQQWAAPIEKFFQKYAKGNFLGNFLRNEGDRDMFGREMMEPGSTKSAQHANFAKSVQEVMKESVARRAAAGEDIKELKNYGLTTNHDGIAMGRQGFEKWAQKARETFAILGGKPISQVEDLGGALRDIYDSVIGQHSGMSPSDPLAGHRQIGFGDYDSWKNYNKDFGMSGGDPVNAVESHLHGAADKISMMEQFGPAPAAMVKHLRNFAFDAATKVNSNTSAARRDLRRFDNIWRGMTEASSPLSQLAAVYKGLRSAVYMRIAEVAYLSQLPVDLFSRVPTLQMMNKMPTSATLRMYSQYAKSLTSDDARQMAIRGGVGGDNIFSELHKGHDQIKREHPILSKVMSANDPIARAFLVHAHMESLPRTMAMEFLSNFARWKDTSFEKLPIKAAMERAGISEGDWDIFRKTEVANNGGIKMLQPVDMMAREDLPKEQLRDVATRMGMFINGEARETVPAANLKNKYALTGNFDPNSVAGMLVQDSTVALQFTMSTMTMLLRGMMLRNSLGGKIRFAAGAGTALLMANSVRLQMKALAAGRDPYSMDPTTKEGQAFWRKAVMTSGFAGPAIDLLDPKHTGSVTSTVGKVLEAGVEGAGYHLGMVKKDPHAGSKIFKQASQFVPGAAGWWSQGLVQYGILDNLQREIDPHAQEEWNRTSKFYHDNYGQGSYWEHGHLAPSRAPDLSKAY